MFDIPANPARLTTVLNKCNFFFPQLFIQISWKKYLWWYHLFPDIAKIAKAVQCHSLWSGCYPVFMKRKSYTGQISKDQKFPPDSALILHPTSLAVPVCCEPCKETLLKHIQTGSLNNFFCQLVSMEAFTKVNCEPCKETLSTYRMQHYIAVRMVGFTLTRSKWISTSMWRTFK